MVVAVFFFSVVSKMVSNIDIFQGIVSKLEFQYRDNTIAQYSTI